MTAAQPSAGYRHFHEQLGELKGWAWVRSFLAYHFTRRYPAWASWLPRHVPRLLPAVASDLGTAYAADGKPRR